MKSKDPRWTPEEMDELARIRPADVERATALMRAASPELAAMAEAEADEEDR
jgi:hypothetical protein